MLKHAQNRGNNADFEDPDGLFDQLSIPRGVLDSLENQFTNPFEQISLMFEEVPLINVKQKRIRMQIPRLFEEDIDQLEVQWRAWIDRNEKILAAWDEIDVS